MGTQVSAPLNDRIYRSLRSKKGAPHPKKPGEKLGRPEFRVPLLFPASLLVPAGLFIYGWTAQYHTHWIGPNVGAAVFAAGTIICFQGIQTYLIDSFTKYAASAIASATVLRSLAGFGFPLFAPYMYAKLDYGWGKLALGLPGYGHRLPSPDDSLVPWAAIERSQQVRCVKSRGFQRGQVTRKLGSTHDYEPLA